MYTNSLGQQRYTNLEKYNAYKGYANEGKVPERKLHDGKVLPAKTLTRTEIVRYASKADEYLRRHNEFMNVKNYLESHPLPAKAKKKAPQPK
jgi:hypothetical protein